MRAEASVIDDFTRDVLRRVVIAGRVVTLPDRLRRPDFRVVREAMTGMGGRWDRQTRGFVFDVDPAGPIGSAVATGVFANRLKMLQQVETPDALAEHVADLARIATGMLLLEPSAGTGSLCRAARARGADVAAIELDHINVGALRAIADIRVWHDDFLRWAARQHTAAFDRVLMHPPFTAGADTTHVLAAWGLLKRGGRLVGIVSEAAFTAEAPQAQRFRAWLVEASVWQIPVPAALAGDVDALRGARIVVADREG